jgi:uncharacterized membrane protein
MRNTTSKLAIAAVTALSLAASVFATAEPASAAWRGGGRIGGGWHGGGWHGGGWRGGYGGGWWGPALVGGLAAGALLAAPYYGYGPYAYGYGGCVTSTPLYDAYGNYIGNQLVRVC